ncbi:glycoside hydrolase family 73 protein [Paenibacillus tarimensis]
MTREQFLAILAPIAVQVRKEGSPLFPSVRLAQNLLETGGTIPSWNNLGGYKVGSGVTNAYWRGQVVNKATWEVVDGRRIETTAAFRAYDNVYNFYKDQDLLFQFSRYAPVRNARTPYAQADALQASGYATDPAYASKLKNLIQTYNLTKYDIMPNEEEEDQMAKDEEQDNRLTALEETLNRLSSQLAQLQSRTNMEAPSWAQTAAKYFAPYFDTKTGSYDFWRILTIMYRQQIAQQENTNPE